LIFAATASGSAPMKSSGVMSPRPDSADACPRRPWRAAWRLGLACLDDEVTDFGALGGGELAVGGVGVVGNLARLESVLHRLDAVRFRGGLVGHVVAPSRDGSVLAELCKQ
jgi:hypothetical protein